MSAQPYTKADLERGEEIVKALHGLRGFEAWAEHIAQALAAERERIAKLVDDFHWTLPLYTTKEVNEASDDAAESVKDQIAAAIRST